MMVGREKGAARVRSFFVADANKGVWRNKLRSRRNPVQVWRNKLGNRRNPSQVWRNKS